ncbi:MAG TPA: POTRA domain-containing protein, partial [Bacteroidota bacterium]|nr:POTRA domain-containing protein [Bacteroidota bacterium]
MGTATRFGTLVLLIGLSARSPGATIRSIAIHGNTVFTAREIAGWLTSRAGSALSPSALQGDLRQILDEYRSLGYLGTRAHFAPPQFTSDSASADLTLELVEGRQTLVAAVRVRGSLRLTEAEILEEFDLRSGAPFNDAVLEQDIQVLLVRYEKLGYPFARCSVGSIDRRFGSDIDSAAIELDVEEGDLMHIDEIRVEGNKETNADVIVRETRIVPGEIYNPTKISAIRQRLNRLNIFSSVSEPELYTRAGKGGLLVKVQEGSTNTFDGIVGYIPVAASGGGGYLTGLASVAMRNLFGTGRKLSFHWQREDRYSQEIGIQYLEPWVFDAPVNLGGGWLQHQQDTSYVRRTLDLRTELMFSEELSVALLFNTIQVIPATDSLTGPRVIGTNEVTAGLEIQYDSRDDIYSPESGARYRSDYHYGHKRITEVPTYAQGLIAGGGTVQRVGVDFEFYIPAFRRQVIAIGLHGREVHTSEVQESEMYQFGGASTLRGYRENQFLGSEVAWTNAEYRFILARRTYFFTFLDTGYYNHPGD